MIKIKGDKFLVTGAAGFIGSHICEELVRQGKQVIAIDDFSNGKLSNLEGLKENIQVVEQDVTDCLPDELFEGVDTVFHEACSKCTVCRDNPIRDLQVNAFGALNVFFHASVNGCKVVHASTGSVYGPTNYHVETAQFNPVSFYGVSKLAGDRYLQALKEYKNGFRFVGLRYFHIYGSRQDSSPIGGVVSIFINRILNNQPIQIFGDGKQARVFTYVKDVVRANIVASNSPDMEGQYFNVASGVRITINELVDAIEGILGVTAKREYLPAKQGDIKDFNVSNAKISPYIDDWTDFYYALEDTIESFK